MLASYIEGIIKIVGVLLLSIVAIKVILGALSIGFAFAIFGIMNFTFISGMMVVLIGGLYRR